MKPWTLPPMLLDEHERLARLAVIGVGQARHDFLDTITALAAATLKCPIALVSLVEEDRQYFASRHGLESTSTARDVSFCAHCIAGQMPLVVDDTETDPRFAKNPLVVGDPSIRSYLGFPLFGGSGQSAVGTFCVIDQDARVWSEEEQVFVGRLAAMVETYLDGLVYIRVWDASPLAFVVLNASGMCVRANAAFGRLVGRTVASVVDQPLASCVLSSDRSVLQAMVVSATTSRDVPTRRALRYVRLTGEVVSGGTSMSPLGDVDGYAICVIRDISLERRQSSVGRVAVQVRQELNEPLTRARDLLAVARADSAAGTEHFDEMMRILDEVEGLVDSRIGDISATDRKNRATTSRPASNTAGAGQAMTAGTLPRRALSTASAARPGPSGFDARPTSTNAMWPSLLSTSTSTRPLLPRERAAISASRGTAARTWTPGPGCRSKTATVTGDDDDTVATRTPFLAVPVRSRSCRPMTARVRGATGTSSTAGDATGTMAGVGASGGAGGGWERPGGDEAIVHDVSSASKPVRTAPNETMGRTLQPKCGRGVRLAR